MATIGNFDGVHLGHQSILRQLAVIAENRQLPLLLIVFEPQPQEFFCHQNAPPRLTRLREKIHALSSLAVDRVLVLRFNTSLATMSPAAFIETILVQKLAVRALVIGDDFRFGYRGSGTVQLLRKSGRIHGFQVVRSAPCIIDNRRVSSSLVRDALINGELATATRLLGRHYAIIGRVQHGDRQGRMIGFPTLNIALHRRGCPLHGVFAVRVYGLNRRAASDLATAGSDGLPAVASVGTRPTVSGKHWLLEVYVFDFDREVYGCEVRVEFVAWLRDERKYESLQAMRPQLVEDVSLAQEALGVLMYKPDRNQRQIR